MISDYEEEMHLHLNPMEALKKRCEVEEQLGGCNDKAVYEAMEIEGAERADDYWDEIYSRELEVLQEKLDHMD
jgi:hypothetical protein